MNSFSHHRRNFLKGTAATAAFGLPHLRAASSPPLGQGDFQYRVVPEWGILGETTPVANCHGIVTDHQDHLILLTTHTDNNVIVYDKAGKLVHKWGHDFPGAHGLSLVQEAGQDRLFITDLKRHLVVKTTLDGEVLQEWQWPESTGKYESADQWCPSWTLHLPDGGFFTLDGYGRDYITEHDASGKFVRIFGGAEGDIPHWGPHGGMMDLRNPQAPELLIAMSDQQYLLRLSLQGDRLGQIDLTGGNPRQIRAHGDHFIMAHLADNWPTDRSSRGFLSILDSNFNVVSNVGGTAPEYDDAGKLRPMKNQSDTFLHPHDLTADSEGSLYVAQFASNNTYPIKLERI